MADWKKNSLHDLHIDSYTAQGFGVARLDGRVVFIPGTIRGEDWKVQLLKVQKNIAWGRGVELLTPSPARVEPDCPISGKCGGCQYRHMTYEEELTAKWDRVNAAAGRPGFGAASGAWGGRSPALPQQGAAARGPGKAGPVHRLLPSPEP